MAMRPQKNLARALLAITTGLALMLGLVLGGVRASAQETMDAPHPAHIHSGSCTELGDIVYPLTDVSAQPMGTPLAGTPESGAMTASPADTMGSTESQIGMSNAGTDMAMASPMGSPVSSPESGPLAAGVESSITTVQAALTDLTAGGYAINVHESMENIQNYIACGDITGDASSGDVSIQLAELNDSGYTGTATLHDNGDGSTAVTITLTHNMG